MKFTLRPASILDKKDIWEMLQEIPKNENGFTNRGNGIAFKEFSNYTNSLINESNEINIKTNRVPQSTYWFLKNGYPIGICKLRTRLTKDLRDGAGHIGFSIRNSERGKGFGTILLKEILIKAKSKGLDQVLIACEKTNIASRKVIEKNGGIFEKETDELYLYWIIFT